MRKFTTLILNLLVLAIALPLGTMAQEVDEPVLYRDAKGYILDAPDHVRLDDPEIDREGGARVTCNIPEVVFTGLAQEVYPSTENTFVARVYSNGLLDQLCAVYYNTYYKSTENGTETAVSSISTYGTIKFNIRTQSSSTTDVSITNGSGQVGFTLLFYNVKALSLGIIDNYCVARNRPLNFTYKLNQYGVYRMHYQITTCSNSASTIPSWASGGYTSGSATCCDGASHSDYYASSCTVSSVLYETDMYMRVVSTKILAHPQGGEICPGGSKTLSVSAETCLSNGITYQWYKDGVAISGATGTSYAATEAGEYYCVTDDGREPRETEHATVTVTQMPEVTLASDQYICPNSSLDLTMPAGATYRWSDNSTAATLNVTTPNTYSVTMTSNGCTAAYSFNVQQLADVDLLADENVAICNGSSITETLSAANATNIVWNNDASLNQSSLTISQPGTYTVSANVNGCAFTDQVAVSAVQYGELISDETVAICEGDSYQVTLNANELSNIVWSGAASGNESTKTFTQPGTYNVSAEYEGCTFNDSFTLSYKTMPTVEVEPNHVLCPNGTVELTMPECDSYIWSDNSTNQTLSVTSPGTYDVTLTSNGCEMSRSFNVAAAPIYNIVEDDAVEFCYGATETLALSVNNATEIAWNGDAANNTATYEISAPGTYTVSAKVGECTYIDQVVATQTENVDLVSATDVNFCYGATETLSLAVDNATEIVWANDPANNAATYEISAPGTYTVSAKVGECTYIDQVVATQTENVDLVSATDVNFCYGATETLSLAVDNATEIVWANDPANNAATYEISAPGTYTVSAKVGECTYIDQVVATQTENVDLVSATDVNFCYGATETLSLAVDNATEIVWANDPANNAATYEISAPGTYTVSAKVGECTYTDQVVATQTENVDLVSATDVNFCYGATETLALSVNNATDIVWANDPVNNAATYEISAPGTYTVSAKVGDCTYTDQVVATQTENVNLLQFDNIQFCYGNSTTLSLTIDNAEDIVWNNDPSLNQSSIEISELGTYTVAATVNGCRYTDQIVAIETQNFDLIEAENVVICYGATATLNVPAAAINVVWNNNNELSGNSLEISEAGTYTVAADYNGCRYNDQVFATVADELTASISAGTINCNGGTANVEASVNGGLPPYAYAWNNQETTQALIGVAAGEYSYVVTDGNGCTETATITITEPAVLSVSINAGAINCNGGTITATAIVEGGVSPYTYAWNSNEIAQTIDATAGECSVIVTDNNGCTATAATTITEPVALSVSINAGTINCNGGITTAEANVIGGSEPYTYTWNNAATSATIEAGAGEYIVTVIDNNRCTAAANATITEPAALAVSLNAGTINCNGGVATVEANVEGGVTPYAYAWNNAATSATIEAVAGDYVVTVTDANNCTASAITALTEPTQLAVLLNAGTILCSGGNAIVEADANGGVAPYAYTWSNGATSATIEAGAGEYIVTVTDNNRCTAAANATITEPAALVVSLNAGTINCNGGTATATAIVAGGTAPYAFSWSNGVNAATAEDLFAGTYSVTVTDDSGCEAMMSTTITEPAALTVTINAGTIGCNGTTATAEAVVEGGVAPYAFAWSNQETTQNITDVVPGNYNLTVTDSNGCTAMANAIVTEPAMLNVSINAGAINCNGGTTTVVANVNGGTTPYAYAWSNDAATATIEAVAGEYSLTVTDSNGCLAMSSTAIEEPAAITASIIAGTINCNGGTTMAVAHANGGVAPYSYAWSNQGTAQNISNIVAGDYSVTITDNNGCTVTTSTTVTEPEYVNLIADETVNFCEGSSVIVTLVEGATNVVWGTDEVGASYEIGIAGTYSVSADVNGCHYTDQVVAVQRPLPESGLNREYSYVINQTDTTIVIWANADYESYSWSNGNTGNSLTIYCDTLILPFDADYNLTITTEYGCSVVDTVSVHVEMSPSSVSEYEVFEWNIVPNPSDGRFDIVCPNFDKAEMFDADGRLLHTIVTKNVDIFDIKPGMYYLRIYSGEITTVLKVLINR